MSEKLNDKFLVASSIAGDEDAFGKLYDKYVDRIYRFVVMRVSSTQEAQDLTAETFLKTWQYISKSHKQIDEFKALLYRVARNLVIDYYRSSKRELTGFEDDQLEGLVDLSLDLESQAQTKDDLRIVFRALDQLPEDYKEIIILRYVQDLSIKEIASVQSKTSGAVRVALHRAVKQLKNILKNF